MKRMLLLVVFLGACGGGGSGNDDGPTISGGDDGQSPGGDDSQGSATPSIDFEPFTARTRSLGLAGDNFQLSITDTQGPIACGLSQDVHNGPGTMGSQVIANITYAAGYPCPTGTYSIHSGCTTEDDFYPYMPEGCAYYRRWDVQGNLLGMTAANAGAIKITGTESSCTIVVNLSFAGQAYADTVTLTNGLTAQPWCK